MAERAIVVPSRSMGLAASCVLALALAACGGEGATPTAEASATPTPTSDGPASLSAPAEVMAGSEFQVTWTGPDGQGDFVSIVAPGTETWTNEPWFSTAAGAVGNLVAPVADGPYEIIYLAGSDREVLARVPIRVTPFEGTVEAPDQVAGGAEFDVAWTGPDGPGDFISILPAGATEWTNESYFSTSSGPSGRLLAPVEAGDYVVWYITGTERALMVSQAIRVTSAEASVEGPDEVGAGTSFAASWTGPDGPGDFISILPAGATEWTNESYFSTSSGPSGSLVAPLVEGTYEIVYITGTDRAILAAEAITVTPIEVSLTAPPTVQRGSTFQVSWTGPDGRGDYVSILPVGATAWTNEPYFYTSAGSPGTLTAPSSPGQYEVWYIFGSPETLLFSISITVN